MDRDFDQMDVKHAAVTEVEDAWDRVDPRNAGAMGSALERPDFKKLDDGFIPKDCRGWASMSDHQRDQFVRQFRAAHGLIPLTGPGRAHPGALGPSPLIEVSMADLKAALRDLGPQIRAIVREAVEKARGRID